MGGNQRAVVGKALLASAMLLGVAGLAVLAGSIPVEDSARKLVATALLVAAAGDVMVAFYFLTRS